MQEPIDHDNSRLGWKQLGLVVLVLFLWGLSSGLAQTVSYLALAPVIESPVIETAVRCAVQLLMAFGFLAALVHWAGAPRIAWLGVGVFAVIEIARLIMFTAGIGAWSSLDQGSRLELLASLGIPQLFAILGAWLGQRPRRIRPGASSLPA